jgi:Holliday junction resolvasome RuvABC ATP-dependent DNA helicase subunit
MLDIDNIPELLPTSSFQYSSTKYAFRALTSGFVDCDDLIHVKSHVIKSISGQSIRIETKQEDIYSSLVSHLSKITQGQSSKALDHNCQLLASGLELPGNSWRFLKLMAVLSTNGGLKTFIENILPSDLYAHALFAAMVNIEEQELINIISVMNHLGVFERICLISLEFLWLPLPIVNKLVGVKVDEYFDLIAPIVQTQDASALRLKDFEHLNPDTMVKFIDIALNNSMPGINILLYGEPGVGKSEFAKVLADKTGAALVAIRALGDDAHNIDGQLHTNNTSSNLRLQYHQLVQRLIPKNEKTLLLVEECEDVFEQSHSIRNLNKDYLNRLVESNVVPTIWVTNHISEIPQSCIRRFTFVQQVEVADNRVMNNIIAKQFRGLRISKDFKQKLASNNDIVPAHISNAALVTHCVEQTGKDAENTIESLVISKLIASGHDISPAKHRPQLPFSTEFLSIQGGNQAISQLERTFTNLNNRHCDIRTLLLGPPGTGKTSIVSHLAEQANRELITVRCSDVLSKYIGESEKNIARIFKEATANESFLFFDEIDSLLLDRSGITQSWEIQQVNELLTQIECFNQPFFAATNFSSRLDKAVMRRFDFKLHFEYLTSPQVLMLYKSLLGKSVFSDKIHEKLLTLKLLTPGDFAICKRRQKISTVKFSHTECLEILTQENNRKQQTKAIGFIN